VRGPVKSIATAVANES